MKRENEMPDWPGAMRRATAAAYLDLTETDFAREVAAGVLPSPFKLGRYDHWNRKTIDAAIARITGEGVPDDWRSRQKAYMG